jgi:hypothetical protein
MKKLIRNSGIIVLLMVWMTCVGLAEPAEEVEETPEEHTRGVRHDQYHRGEMHPDRPELTFSARTVAPGRVQLESELAVEREEGASENKVVLPSLLRIGVIEGLELRLESDLLVFEGERRGISDLSVGVKWNLIDGEPAIGILADVVIPAGQEHFRSESAIPSLRIMSDIPLGESWEMRLNLGAASLSEDGERELQALFGVAFFTELSENLEAHVEYGRLGARRGTRGRPVQIIDTGVAYRLDDDTHIDLGFYKGINNKEALDWKVIVGFAKRF